MLRLVVTGGRNFVDANFISEALNFLHQRDRVITLIHGDAAGVDRICGFWAMANDINCIAVPARWNNVQRFGAIIRHRADGSSYDLLAGHFRNQQMIDFHRPNYAIAFPGGSGTADMVRRIKFARIPLWDLSAHCHL